MPQRFEENSGAAPMEPFSERRAVGRALNCWDGLKPDNGFPRWVDCLSRFDSRIQPGLLLIETGPVAESDTIIEAGPDFIEALGRDPIGLPAHAILPSSTERGLIFWRVAAELKKPIADVGGFTNANGIDIKYRSVFLPVSDDSRHVTHLLGAFSYKTVH